MGDFVVLQLFQVENQLVGPWRSLSGCSPLDLYLLAFLLREERLNNPGSGLLDSWVEHLKVRSSAENRCKQSDLFIRSRLSDVVISIVGFLGHNVHLFLEFW